MITHLEPQSFAKAIVLQSADIPPNMTIAQWRMHKQSAIARREPRRRSGRRWWAKRAR
jgi:hypothetical protein